MSDLRPERLKPVAARYPAIQTTANYRDLLDNPGIDYRLTYSTPLRRSQYVDSRWAAPPAQLLAQQLRRSTGLVAVDRMAADCLLRIELREFSQVFTSPQTSHGVLSGQAELIDGQRRLIVSRPIDVEHPALGPVQLPGPPLRFFDGAGQEWHREHTAPPLLGQHTDEVLGWLADAGDPIDGTG